MDSGERAVGMDYERRETTKERRPHQAGISRALGGVCITIHLGRSGPSESWTVRCGFDNRRLYANQMPAKNSIELVVAQTHL